MKKIISLLLSIILVMGCLSCVAFAADDATKLVVLGDSIAYGTGLANSVPATYGKIIADTNGYEYANFSVPGHNTFNMLARLDVEEVAAGVAEADIVAISIGGNDFLTNDMTGIMFESIVKKDFSRFDTITSDLYDNFCAIVDKINNLNENAVIMIQTIYNPQETYLHETYAYATDLINSKFYKYDEEHPGEIIIVDVASALNGDYDNFAADAIHPSVKGNELIAQAYVDVLKEQGLGENTELVITEKGQDQPMLLMLRFMFDPYAILFTIIAKVFSIFGM